MAITPNVPNTIGGEIRANPLNQNFNTLAANDVDLQAQVDANDIDIANRYTKAEVDSLNNAISATVTANKAEYDAHVDGTADKHNSDAIVNTSTVVGSSVSGALNTVQQQVNALVVSGTTNTTIGTYSLQTTGTANAYLGTFAGLTYFGGLKLNATINVTNTGASTFNLNGLGVKNIKKVNDVGTLIDLVAGDLTIGEIAQLEYDGVQFKLINVPTDITVLNERDILCGIPQSVTIANATSVIPKFDFNPRHIINPLGKIGGFYKDSNSDGLADGWTGSKSGTFSLTNGEQVFTPTENGGSIYKTSMPNNRTIVTIAHVKTADSTAVTTASGTPLAAKLHTGSGSYEKIGKLVQTNGGNFYAAYSDKTTGFVPITVKQAFYVDVTDYPELVGLTNQQKLDWCLANLEYCDGIGVTKNPTVRISNTYKNLLGYLGGFYKDSNSDGLADGWTVGSSTGIGLINGEQTYTPSSVNDRLVTSSSFTTGIGKIIIAISNVKTTDNTVKPDFGGTFLAQKIHSGSGNFEKVARMVSTTLTNSIFIASYTLKTSSFVPITVKQAYAIDVTTDYPEILNKGWTNQQILDWLLANTEYHDGEIASYTTIQGDFLTGDEISISNNETVGNKLWSSKKTLYGKDYAFVNDSDATGYKVANLPVSTFKDVLSSTLDLLQLPDATQAVRVTTITAANQFILTSNGQIKISVADSVTGFGEAESVTDDMWRAFFNGWKKTGASTWVSVVDGTTAPAVQTIDFVKANVASNYDGYWLYYQYTTVKTIDDNSRDYLAPLVGDDINLDKGINTVTLINGVVESEVANPIFYSTDGYWYINENFSTLVGSNLMYKAEDILEIRKNGNIDSAWIIQSDPLAFGGKKSARILNANYDMSAVYTVNYTILNAISPQIGSGSFEYKEGIVDGYNNLVEVVNSKQDKSIILNDIVDKSLYEKNNYYVSNRAIAMYLNLLGITHTVKLSNKLARPIITPTIIVAQYIDSTGAGINIPLTDCKVLSIVFTDNDSLIIYFAYTGSDSTIKTNIKDNGMLIRYELIADCRGRV